MGIRNLLLLGVPMDASGPTNTAAPAITAASVIGQENTATPGTWTGSPTLTYQWQRNTGAWADIAGATNKDYTPVDADFGYALRLGVIPNGITAKTAYSNATGLVAEAPAQSLGNELLTNGNFSAWTGNNPDGWTVTGESGSDPEVTQRAPIGVHADAVGVGGAANLYSSATIQPVIKQTVMDIGSFYLSQFDVTARAAGSLRMYDSSGGMQGPAAVAVGTYLHIGRATDAGVQIRQVSSGGDITVDNVSCKKITTNLQLVAPSANMRLDQFYTLPVSPLASTQIWLYLRISDFAAGNYWRCELLYSGSQWNINLYSVATNIGTSRISATNIGATNGLRVNMNGDQISLYTTANGGTDWTQHGTTITNNTYQTSTGVNALWTSDVTPGNLVYAAAV